MVKDILASIELFLKGAGFYRGVVLTIAIVIPLVLLYFTGYIVYAASVVLGVFVNAPSDIPGSLKRKINGLLISIALTSMVTLVVLLAKPYILVLLITLALVTFISAMIAIYGFRGSLIAFSGLLAMVLALAVKNVEGNAIWLHVGLIILGGLWYVLISFLFRKGASKKDEKQLLSDTLQLTGEYLQLRGELLIGRESHDAVFKQLLEVQTKISDKHETLRESL